MPLDAATRATLQQQLVVARDTAMRYPTTADAVAAGYHVVGGFGPGSGAHYIGGYGGVFGGGFDPSKPLALIYDGTSPTSQMVGLMYYAMGNTAPEGFAGPNDHWHRHSNVCTRGAEVLSPPDSDISQEDCAALGGRFMTITGWMVHAWVVPVVGEPGRRLLAREPQPALRRRHLQHRQDRRLPGLVTTIPTRTGVKRRSSQRL